MTWCSLSAASSSVWAGVPATPGQTPRELGGQHSPPLAEKLEGDTLAACSSRELSEHRLWKVDRQSVHFLWRSRVLGRSGILPTLCVNLYVCNYTAWPFFTSFLKISDIKSTALLGGFCLGRTWWLTLHKATLGRCLGSEDLSECHRIEDVWLLIEFYERLWRSVECPLSPRASERVCTRRGSLNPS